MLKQSFSKLEPPRTSWEVAPSQSLPTVKETISGSLTSMEQAEGVRLNGTSSSSPPTNGTASLPPTPTSPAQPEPGASKPVPIPGNVASGGGPAGPPQQRSSLKLSRAASSNLSTSDEPQPLLSRSAESLHGASAAVRRAKQELMFFASIGDVKRCSILVQTAQQLYGTEIAEFRDWQMRTPLHVAASKGCYALARWLIKKQHVDVNPIDQDGRTPLADAVRGDYMEVAALLQKNGGKVRGPDGDLTDYELFTVKSMEDVLLREWEIDPVDVRLMEKIGEGEFGQVFRAEWHSCIVAVKMLKRSDEIAMNDFRTELDVLQKMHHPNTVQFLGACTRKQPFMIVTEYMPGGSLADLLKRPSSFPSMRRAIVMAMDCARAMAYLHLLDRTMVIHRDLKPANLLIGGVHASKTSITQVAARYGVVKVADFGLSRVTTLLRTGLGHTSFAGSRSLQQSFNEAKQPQHAKKPSIVPELGADLDRPSTDDLAREVYNYTGETGTYRYMAPEVFRHEPYNAKADVYSFAMICYELFEGSKPFGQMDAMSAARAASLFDRRPSWGKLNRFGKKVPSALVELVEECWAPAMEDRPDFKDITKRFEIIWAEITANDTEENDLVGSGKPRGGCCTQ